MSVSSLDSEILVAHRNYLLTPSLFDVNMTYFETSPHAIHSQSQLSIEYGSSKGKSFTEDEDRFLACMMHKLGYGRWEELKLEIRKAWQFRFDWFIKAVPLELQREV